MLTCVLINVVLNGVTIPLWGARGAAWTTLISEAFLAVWLVKLNFTELRILSAREEVSVLEKKVDHA